MKKIEREDAQARELTRYYTGRPCKHGHVAERYTQNGMCVECQRGINSEWHKTVTKPGRKLANPKARREREALYMKAHARTIKGV